LERGPASPLFENMGFDGDEEYGFCKLLHLPAFERGHGLSAAEVFETHRRSHVTEATIIDIKAMGLNAVRVPFGYWCVLGPTKGDPYVGPSLHHLDNVVDWCEKHRLQVLLDLHGNPGGESSEKPCGRSMKSWSFSCWRKDESLEALRIVATRYKDRVHVAGLQVANETGRLVDPVKLVDHYADCARVIRECGMLAENVAVVCPFYFHGPPIGTSQKRRFLKRWAERVADLDHCILDLHYYHFSEFDREHIRGTLHTQVTRYNSELEALPATVVGEFSAGRPPACSSMNPQKFFEMQLSLYMANSTHGAFFWCWSDGAGGDWSLKDADETRREAIKSEAEVNRQRNPNLEATPREELIRKLSIKENDDD